MEQLNKSFITPLDREDIHVMILRIDDVVDLTNAAANRMAFFGIQKPTQPRGQFGEADRARL